MIDYVDRVADEILADALSRAGAVLVEGPKGCGKTETARQAAKSEVRVDVDPRVEIAMGIDPALVLDGDTPRLVDEWQVQPLLWDTARHLVDDRQEKGQFIFTGSTASGEQAARHSGAGRFARVRMRTMTLFETGDSTGTVSLQNLAAGEEIRAVESSMNISTLFERMCRGGWPTNLELTLAQAQANNRDYARTIAEVDIRTPDGAKRDPEKVMKVLRSLSRGLATEMSVATIAKDTGINWETVSDYLDSLQRIFISEDQLAWSQNLRSRTPLRKAPKRHLTDPALALAVLNVSPEALVKNLPFAGQVFESFVVHELRALTARPVYHARLEDGLEVDALVEMDDAILAVEIKLGHSKEVVDGAAANLLKFAKLLDGNVVPVVITGSGLSYQRLDGVNVVAIDALAR
ncbi:ATP-binding protein [Corynebacterium glucuronolyticum]|uniref:ATP-binding protein n=1 Tax=Corynebacterium glucuronolyticum TaxID=39791 RepID=UPI000305C09E|nr:DUF4143 domain-containing protein [Corynebacterium glucuronolyticum]MCT1563410.1 DUF4143 domain-containing protein [Corynebacterium glucuronolyticum]QRO82381.1 ATP-binding protein [Corynebacterium glucuronolyticum]